MPLRLELLLKDIKKVTDEEAKNMKAVHRWGLDISYTVQGQEDIDNALSDNLKLLIISDSGKYCGTFGIKLTYVEVGAPVIMNMTLPKYWEVAMIAPEYLYQIRTPRGGGGKRKRKKSKRKHKKSRPQRKKSKRKSK